MHLRCNAGDGALPTLSPNPLSCCKPPLLMARLAFFLLPLLFIRCDTATEELAVDFQFRLLKADGSPAVAFEKGEDIVFSFLVINNGTQPLAFQNFDTDGFLEVYQLASGNVWEASMGKPYTGVFCDYRLGGIQIAPQDTLVVQSAWLSADEEHGNSNGVTCGHQSNELLPKGHYKTGFSSAFVFNAGGEVHTTPMRDFEIYFSVD